MRTRRLCVNTCNRLKVNYLCPVTIYHTLQLIVDVVEVVVNGESRQMDKNVHVNVIHMFLQALPQLVSTAVVYNEVYIELEDLNNAFGQCLMNAV